jgi:hypothetical protein
VLDTIADDANVPRIGDLAYRPEPGAGATDVTMSSLGRLVTARLQPSRSS